MSDAAVNGMVAQVTYGNDELRAEMREFILDTIREVLNKNLDPQLTTAIAYAVQQDVGKYVVVNKAHEIEKIAARYLMRKLQSDQI